jgi:hypothetical protein
VNSGERVPGRDKQLELVNKFLSTRDFAMITVMDFDTKVAQDFEVMGIPHLVVIAPDGTIMSVESGYNPNLVTHLKQLTVEALKG